MPKNKREKSLLQRIRSLLKDPKEAERDSPISDINIARITIIAISEENRKLRKQLEAAKEEIARARAGAQEAARNKRRCHEKHERAKKHLREMQGAVQRAKAEAYRKSQR